MNTKTTFQPRTVGLLVTVLLAAGLFSGCSKPKEGWIVRDKSGNYYELTGDHVIGEDRYRLIPIDTTKFKPVGFLPCR